MERKKIAIIGGGIYGCTTAISLAKKYEVHLFEKNKDILLGASMVNQYRLHRGYHYPRSQETVAACLKSENNFRDFYKGAIIDSYDHFYAIARKNSKTTTANFKSFCKTNNLFLEETSLPFVNHEAIDSTFKVKESIINPLRIYKQVKSLLLKTNIHLHLRCEARIEELDSFDQVIVATYSDINSTLGESIKKKRNYQFEVCEKVLVKLPSELKNQSFVVMDGPFMCFDPYADTEYHLMGNVNEAIHSTNTGHEVVISKKILPLINQGFIKNPPVTKFKSFISTSVEFVPALKQAKHIASMYTVRSVLPNKDSTDERPTIVRQVNKRVITIFSGKISNCVDAAESVLELL